MPLSYDDIPGSWGPQSKGWPSITFKTEEEAKHAHLVAWKFAKVPYGSYVLVGKSLRLETKEFKAAVKLKLKVWRYKQ